MESLIIVQVSNGLVKTQKKTQVRFNMISIVNKDTVSSQQDSPRIALQHAEGGTEVMEQPQPQARKTHNGQP